MAVTPTMSTGPIYITNTATNATYTTSGTISVTVVDPAVEREQRRQALWEKHCELPVLKEYDGPVYANDHYYDGIDSAIDTIVDDGEHPAYAIAHPCKESKVATPAPVDLLEQVDEWWGENFEDYEGENWSQDVLRAAENLVVALQNQAPTLWEADFKHRIVLAEPELDDEYDPGEDTYDD
jgi:hypothetical protein